MRFVTVALLLPLGLAGCGMFKDIESAPLYAQSVDGGSCPKPPDMATPPPKCAAADGLKGDNLLCVDFKDVQMLSTLAGWDFTTSCSTLWTTTGGKLQVNNFSAFMSSCTFTVPALSAADYQKYSRFTLSLVQRVDLNETQQKAQIMLGADDPPTRLLKQETGKQPWQRNVYEVLKTDLPLQAMGGFQPLFKLSSFVASGPGNTGWQIESIAIHGVP